MCVVLIKIFLITVVAGAVRIRDKMQSIMKNIREKVDYHH